MRFRTLSLVCTALIVLSASVVAAQSALPLDGTWKGALAEKRTTRSRGVQPPPQSLVVVQISTASDGRFGGGWTIAGASKRLVLRLDEITIDGDAIRIDVPPEGVWEGKLSSDGLTLAGEWRQGSKTTPLVLRRTGNADEPVTFSSSSPGTVAPR